MEISLGFSGGVHFLKFRHYLTDKHPRARKNWIIYKYLKLYNIL